MRIDSRAFASPLVSSSASCDRLADGREQRGAADVDVRRVVAGDLRRPQGGVPALGVPPHHGAARQVEALDLARGQHRVERRSRLAATDEVGEHARCALTRIVRGDDHPSPGDRVIETRDRPSGRRRVTQARRAAARDAGRAVVPGDDRPRPGRGLPRRDHERARHRGLTVGVAGRVEDPPDVGVRRLLPREVVRADQVPVLVRHDRGRIVERVHDLGAVLEPRVRPPPADGERHEQRGEGVAPGGQPRGTRPTTPGWVCRRGRGDGCRGIRRRDAPSGLARGRNRPPPLDERAHRADEQRRAEDHGADAEDQGDQEHGHIGPRVRQDAERDLRPAPDSGQHTLADAAAPHRVVDRRQAADHEKHGDDLGQKFEGAAETEEDREAQRDPHRPEADARPQCGLGGGEHPRDAGEDGAEPHIDRQQDEGREGPGDDEKTHQQRERTHHDEHDRRSPAHESRHHAPPGDGRSTALADHPPHHRCASRGARGHAPRRPRRAERTRRVMRGPRQPPLSGTPRGLA